MGSESKREIALKCLGYRLESERIIHHTIRSTRPEHFGQIKPNLGCWACTGSQIHTFVGEMRPVIFFTSCFHHDTAHGVHLIYNFRLGRSIRLVIRYFVYNCFGRVVIILLSVFKVFSESSDYITSQHE